jgi:hypothetical protein
MAVPVAVKEAIVAPVVYTWVVIAVGAAGFVTVTTTPVLVLLSQPVTVCEA